MWFEDLFGFEEGSADQVRKNLTVSGDRMTSRVNGREIGCGTLEVASLGELRTRTADLPAGSTGLTLRQIVGDVGALHRDEGNAGALFQAASQFNLLEMVSPSVIPEAGVTGYAHDRTQGPVCAIACGAGTIYRNYFALVNGQVGQTFDNQIDCLADIGAHLFPAGDVPWTMTNGYAMFDSSGLKKLNIRLADLSAEEVDAVRAELRIGLHHNVEVTTAPTGHSVTQAYCSALPVAYNNCSPLQFEAFARLVLEASYETTLRAAVLNSKATGNQTVYLTLLGGGVFGNDETWITEAIERASKLVSEFDLDVAVVSYGSPSRAVAKLVEHFD